MSRLPSLRRDDLGDSGQAVWDQIVAGRGGQLVNEEGGLAGPFNAWVHAPEAGSRLAELGGQDWEEASSFFDIVCSAQLAENVAQSVAKGVRVVVEGRLDQRSWDTPRATGTRRSRSPPTTSSQMTPKPAMPVHGW